MVRSHLWIVFVLLVVGCHTEISPSKPHASVSEDSSCIGCDGPIAVGTPLRLAASWHGVCENGPSFNLGIGAYWGGGDQRETSHTCKHVEFTPQVACVNDACRVEDRGYTLIPVKAGLLQAKVTFRPTAHSKSPRTVDLQGLMIQTPSRLDAKCAKTVDGKTVDVDVELVDRAVLRFDPRVVQVSAGGQACKSLAELGERQVVTWDPDGSPSLAHAYRCPTGDTKVQIEAKGADFAQSAWVACN